MIQSGDYALEEDGQFEGSSGSGCGIRDIYLSRKERRRENVRERVDAQGVRRHGNEWRYVHADGRQVNTREYAIAWGVKNRPYSSGELRRLCREDPESPSYDYLVKQEWKGYTRYYKALVNAGMERRPPRTDNERREYVRSQAHDGFVRNLLDKDYALARTAAARGVSTQAEYDRMRSEDGSLPSVATVVRRFGTWKRFQYEVLKYSADITLDRYVRKSVSVGHWLTIKECDREGIPIRKYMDLLQPMVFNAVCYRKMEALGGDRKKMIDGGMCKGDETDEKRE